MGAEDTRRYPRAENRVWTDQEDHEERGSKDRAASTCGPHSDSFNDASRHSFMADPLLIFVPRSARVGSAKTAHAIVSLCT
ncbi:hypothetical protein TNCV_1556381 [Trichonephila clavipes]|nr:hypothetical protein TNCV_1556381 [Trichonephila clavipes]